MTMPQTKTTGELATDVLNDVTHLVRAEGELARAEIRENVNTAVAGIAGMIGAAAVLLAGVVCALIAMGYALVDFAGLDSWLAFALAALVGLVIGAVMIASAKSALKAEALAPTRTATNLRRDAAAIRENV